MAVEQKPATHRFGDFEVLGTRHAPQTRRRDSRSRAQGPFASYSTSSQNPDRLIREDELLNAVWGESACLCQTSFARAWFLSV